MAYSNLHLLPLSVFFIFPATFLTTYIISVLLGHTEAAFPYISDTGAYSPESCIFAQCVNFGSFLIVLTVYIRYRQVVELYAHHSSHSYIVRANTASLVTGCIAALGMSLAANFQETNVFVVHVVGAMLAFGGATVFLWLQAYISYETHPVLNSLATAHVRLAFAVLAALFFVLGATTAIISHAQFDGVDHTKWYPSNGGWVCHVVSTASEWVCAACFSGFMVTLVEEFRSVSVETPQVSVTVESFSSYGGIGGGQYSSVESVVSDLRSRSPEEAVDTAVLPVAV